MLDCWNGDIICTCRSVPKAAAMRGRVVVSLSWSVVCIAICGRGSGCRRLVVCRAVVGLYVAWGFLLLSTV